MASPTNAYSSEKSSTTRRLEGGASRARLRRSSSMALDTLVDEGYGPRWLLVLLQSIWLWIQALWAVAIQGAARGLSYAFSLPQPSLFLTTADEQDKGSYSNSYMAQYDALRNMKRRRLGVIDNGGDHAEQAENDTGRAIFDHTRTHTQSSRKGQVLLLPRSVASLPSMLPTRYFPAFSMLSSAIGDLWRISSLRKPKASRYVEDSGRSFEGKGEEKDRANQVEVEDDDADDETEGGEEEEMEEEDKEQEFFADADSESDTDGRPEPTSTLQLDRKERRVRPVLSTKEACLKAMAAAADYGAWLEAATAADRLTATATLVEEEVEDNEKEDVDHKILHTSTLDAWIYWITIDVWNGPPWTERMMSLLQKRLPFPPSNRSSSERPERSHRVVQVLHHALSVLDGKHHDNEAAEDGSGTRGEEGEEHGSQLALALSHITALVPVLCNPDMGSEMQTRSSRSACHTFTTQDSYGHLWTGRNHTIERRVTLVWRALRAVRSASPRDLSEWDKQRTFAQCATQFGSSALVLEPPRSASGHGPGFTTMVTDVSNDATSYQFHLAAALALLSRRMLPKLLVLAPVNRQRIQMTANQRSPQDQQQWWRWWELPLWWCWAWLVFLEGAWFDSTLSLSSLLWITQPRQHQQEAVDDDSSTTPCSHDPMALPGHVRAAALLFCLSDGELQNLDLNTAATTLQDLTFEQAWRRSGRDLNITLELETGDRAWGRTSSVVSLSAAQTPNVRVISALEALSRPRPLQEWDSTEGRWVEMEQGRHFRVPGMETDAGEKEFVELIRRRNVRFLVVQTPASSLLTRRESAVSDTYYNRLIPTLRMSSTSARVPALLSRRTIEIQGGEREREVMVCNITPNVSGAKPIPLPLTPKAPPSDRQSSTSLHPLLASSSVSSKSSTPTSYLGRQSAWRAMGCISNHLSLQAILAHYYTLRPRTARSATPSEPSPRCQGLRQKSDTVETQGSLRTDSAVSCERGASISSMEPSRAGTRDERDANLCAGRKEGDTPREDEKRDAIVLTPASPPPLSPFELARSPPSSPITPMQLSLRQRHIFHPASQREGASEKSRPPDGEEDNEEGSSGSNENQRRERRRASSTSSSRGSSKWASLSRETVRLFLDLVGRDDSEPIGDTGSSVTTATKSRIASRYPLWGYFRAPTTPLFPTEEEEEELSHDDHDDHGSTDHEKEVKGTYGEDNDAVGNHNENEIGRKQRSHIPENVELPSSGLRGKRGNEIRKRDQQEDEEQAEVAATDVAESCVNGHGQGANEEHRTNDKHHSKKGMHPLAMVSMKNNRSEKEDQIRMRREEYLVVNDDDADADNEEEEEDADDADADDADADADDELEKEVEQEDLEEKDGEENEGKPGRWWCLSSSTLNILAIFALVLALAIPLMTILSFNDRSTFYTYIVASPPPPAPSSFSTTLRQKLTAVTWR